MLSSGVSLVTNISGQNKAGNMLNSGVSLMTDISGQNTVGKMLSGVNHVTADISRQNKAGKIKGTVVLMSKQWLDFNLKISKGAATSVFDGLPHIFGGGVTLRLISSTKVDPGNGNGKIGRPAPLEEGLLLRVIMATTLSEGQAVCSVQFDYDHEFGVPGAFLIKNTQDAEFFLVSLTLDDLPNHGSIHFVCNSWIYPQDKYGSDERIFFANKPYLPRETPAPLRKYRELELQILRGNGYSECKEWDRVYDYATYNDLGDPDKDQDLARPTLGGSSDYPYPRRGRTGRQANKSDPSTESRLSLLESFYVYVPRDERYGHAKFKDFLADSIRSLIQRFYAKWEEHNIPNSKEFTDYDDVRDLYKDGLKLPELLLKELLQLHLPFLSDIFPNDSPALIFPIPSVIKDNLSGWMTDEEFARETLAGVNPCSIQCLQEFPPKSQLDANVYGHQTSKITKEQLEQNMNGLTVDEALRSKGLFILDHHDAFMPYLGRINTKTDNRGYATRTIFFLKHDGTLKPLAIELSLPHPNGNEYGAVSKVILPANEGVEATIWLLAKAYVTVNDSGVHQLISHWLNTHATMEPFIIATNRELSVLHPINKLLHPHFRDTMNINALAREALINAGGTIEEAFLPGVFSMEMSSKVYKNWVFTDQALPADLIKRGMAVEDPNCPHGLRLAIEDYPFAVDGLEIWATIKTWVHDYVSCYYESDETIKADTELQAWWKELVEVGHGDLKDKPWWPKMQTRDELIESCTIIIWIASALHAAINFGQYPYGGYILNRPTKTRRFLPEKETDKEEYEEMKTNPEKAYLNTITPKDATLKDISVIEILSSHASDEVYLGTRDNPNWTCDVKPLQAFKRFGKKLSEIEERLIARNNDENLRNRTGIVNMPYTLLYPTSGEGITFRGIPNSISI